MVHLSFGFLLDWQTFFSTPLYCISYSLLHPGSYYVAVAFLIQSSFSCFTLIHLPMGVWRELKLARSFRYRLALCNAKSLRSISSFPASCILVDTYISRYVPITIHCVARAKIHLEGIKLRQHAYNFLVQQCKLSRNPEVKPQNLFPFI